MKVLEFDPQDARLEPLPAEAGPPEYVLTFPVPGPECPGESVFLTLTPDGRPAAIMVDDVLADDRIVRGFLNRKAVVTIPKEAPWMLVRRDLLTHQTRAEARAKMESVYRGLLGMGGGAGGGVCPVHGVEESSAQPTVEGGPSTGQYL